MTWRLILPLLFMYDLHAMPLYHSIVTLAPSTPFELAVHDVRTKYLTPDVPKLGTDARRIRRYVDHSGKAHRRALITRLIARAHDQEGLRTALAWLPYLTLRLPADRSLDELIMTSVSHFYGDLLTEIQMGPSRLDDQTGQDVIRSFNILTGGWSFFGRLHVTGMASEYERLLRGDSRASRAQRRLAAQGLRSLGDRLPAAHVDREWIDLMLTGCALDLVS